MPQFLVGNTTTSDTAGVDIFSSATDYAEGEVNSALVTNYDPTAWTTTGAPGIPPSVRALAADIACYRAIRLTGVQDSQMRNLNLVAFEGWEKRLEALSSGDKKLAYTDGSLVPSRTATRMQSSTEGYAPIFDLDTDTAWKRDSNEIDDTSAGRD